MTIAEVQRRSSWENAAAPPEGALTQRYKEEAAMIEMALEDPAVTADHDDKQTDCGRPARPGALTIRFFAAIHNPRSTAASPVIKFPSQLQVVTQ
jgi:hypothetical protein